MSYFKYLLLSLVVLCSMNLAFSQDDSLFKKIGESTKVSYVMYTDNDRNLYYVNIRGKYLDLLKYDFENDMVIKIADDFVAHRNYANEGFGAIAPTITGDTVYCMTTAGSGSGYADIFRLVCSEEKLEHFTQICGTAYWKIFNLTLSRDGKSLYYISNNVNYSQKALYKIDHCYPTKS